MNRHSLTIHYSEIPQKLLTPADATLVARALEAAQDAYAPFSKFGVGAAVLLDDGQIFTGNNQENAAFPAGICAERSVIAYIHANYPLLKIRTRLAAYAGRFCWKVKNGPDPPYVCF